MYRGRAALPGEFSGQKEGEFHGGELDRAGGLRSHGASLSRKQAVGRSAKLRFGAGRAKQALPRQTVWFSSRRIRVRRSC